MRIKTDYLTSEVFQSNRKQHSAENKSIELLKMIIKTEQEEKDKKISEIHHPHISGSAQPWAAGVWTATYMTKKLDVRIKCLETILQLFIESV